MADNFQQRRLSRASAGAQKVASTYALNTGRCITCRQELRKKKNPFYGDGHYDVPLTVEHKVYKGRCLRCNPFPRTAIEGSVTQGKVSGGNKSRSGSAAQDFNRRQEVDRHHHARLSSSNQFSFNTPCYDRKQSSAAAHSTSKLRNANHPRRDNPSNLNVLPIAQTSEICAVTIPLEVDIRKKHSGLKSFFHSILPSSLSREANLPIRTVYIPSRQVPSDDDSLGMYSHTEDHKCRRRSA
jgi:hypothetical protein